MAKKKNLTTDDLEDLQVWEDHSHRIEYKATPDFKNKKIEVKCLGTKQKELKKAIENNDITIAIGPAGTGKTYLSLITSLHLLKSQPQYRKIVLIKSVTTIKGEELGFLPGTLQEKMEPYMWSYLGNLNKIFGDRTTSQKMMDAGKITIEPIAYVRGNTMDNCMLPGTTIVLSNGEEIEIEQLYSLLESILDTDEKIFVKTYNFEKDIIENKELNKIAKNPIVDSDEIFEVELQNGEKLQLTGTHKLFVKDKGYTLVKDIEENDVLIGF